MQDTKLAERSERTLRIIEPPAQNVALEHISSKDELDMLSNLAPVIVQELITEE